MACIAVPDSQQLWPLLVMAWGNRAASGVSRLRLMRSPPVRRGTPRAAHGGIPGVLLGPRLPQLHGPGVCSRQNCLNSCCQICQPRTQPAGLACLT